MGWFLGLGGGYFHDSAACLVHDGKIVAFAEEERFSRRKHNGDSRSCRQAVSYCLHEAGIGIEDVDGISAGWNPYWPERREFLDDSVARELLGDYWTDGVRAKGVRILPHHLAHAASAFYCSGASDAAVLVADGSGDGISTSLWHGGPNGLRLIREWPFTQSLGWFFETVAEHLGFASWTDAGKLMGLAPYGSDRYRFPFIRVDDDGYRIDLSAFGLPAAGDFSAEYADLAYYQRLKEAYRTAFTDLGMERRRPVRRYDADSGQMATITEFSFKQMDFAASAQHQLEQCLVSLARSAMRATGSDKLCLAGGVALSCSANGVLAREFGAEKLFVQPAAGDSGLAIGGALELAREAGDLPAGRDRLTSMALGPSFSDDTVGRTLRHLSLTGEFLGDRIESRVAEELAAGKVVGWFQGRMEGGPRALGQRSILGDPRSVAVRDRINKTVKNRESWRPLAPSMLRSAADKYVDGQGPADFMIVAYQATDPARADIPGVVHVDGSMRPQIIDDSAQTPYARLLTAFHAATGVGTLLNTSFNHESEPIVSSPRDALRTFYSTPMDLLAIGGHLLSKP
ncbi:hypothetical protein OIE52_50835 [Streptomyces canus]|uniref:carbamoyltransferase family protein n=1 Tax=Streptomyces canus TaxID=58343 RepID=UPI0030E03B56